PTPSAAAELCSPSIVDLAARLVDTQQAADRLVHERLKTARNGLEDLTSTFQRVSPKATIHADRLRVKESRVSLWRHPGRGAAAAGATVDQFQDRASLAMRESLSMRHRRLDLDRTRLLALDPGRVLRRGYAHLTSDDQSGSITSVGDVALRDRLSARLVDGEI